MIVKKFRIYKGIVLKRIRFDIVHNVCTDYKCRYRNFKYDTDCSDGMWNICGTVGRSGCKKFTYMPK